MSDSASLRELFEEVVVLDPLDRVAYFDQHGIGASQRAAVERLLSADLVGAPRLFDKPIDAVLDCLGEADDALTLPATGTTIGPFVLLDKIGEGGSSVVFRARREQAGVVQHVALKLLRRGIYSTEDQRQFRRERLALAQLQHPGIAHLIEGGVTETGTPYIALELIDGVPITVYARANCLDLRRRLLIFASVCRAVEAAHRALIVHRDLKPSNVLVTRDGAVKLLDFGIAKMIDSDPQNDTRTQHGAMTPAYAAPEQFNAGLVTTATDVYSLGILLSELITGVRRVAGDSRTPSSQIHDDTAPGILPAPARSTRRLLRGDLDNIVMKSTSHEPAQRYASAGTFADEIERYLSGQPVSAHPPSNWYRVSKFVGRHKGGAVTTLAFVLAVFSALGIALWQADVARRQARIAQEQAARADSIRDFLVGVFDQAEPDANLGKPITAAQLLQQGETQLSAGADMPIGTRLDLIVLIAHLHWDLGDYAHAEPLLNQAVQLASSPAIPDEIRARTLMMVAKTESFKRKFDDALSHASQALVVAQRAGSAGTESASEARRVTADALVGKDNSTDAEPILRQALVSDRAQYGNHHHSVIDDLTLLGGVLTELSRFDEAEDVLHEAIDLAQQTYGPNHSSVAQALEKLGETISDKGEFVKAEDVQRQVVAIMEKVYGPLHDETLTAQHNLLFQVEHQGRYAEALPQRLKMIETLERLPIGMPRTLAPAYVSLGNDYLKLGRLEEAESALRKALAVWAQLQGSNEEWDSADPMVILADILKWQGRFTEAETTIRHAIAIEQPHEPPDSGWLNRDRASLGDILRLEHRYDAALKETSAAAEARRAAKPDPIQPYLLSRLSIAQLESGDVEKAHETAVESLTVARAVFPAGYPSLSGPLYVLARADLGQGNATEAEPLLREAIAVASPPYPDFDLRVLEMKVSLIDAMQSEGRGEEAATLRSQIEPTLRSARSPYAADLLKRLARVQTPPQP